MLFGMITRDGEIMPAFIFLRDPRLNIDAYIKCLENVVIIYIKRADNRRLYVLQQDFALYHTSRRTQSLSSEYFCNYITPNVWLPNYPGCNALDYYMWIAVKQESNKTPCNTKTELKARITAAFSNLNKETVEKACQIF